MTKKKFYQELRFWIGIIVIIIVISNIGLCLLKPDWTTKIELFISLDVSLLGGLITLISISITNEYYNKEKIKEQHRLEIEKVENQIKILEYLLEEFDENKKQYEKYGQDSLLRITKLHFQTAIWDEFRKEFIEIFLKQGIFNILPKLEYFYSKLKNNETTGMEEKEFDDYYKDLTNGIIQICKIHKSIRNYMKVRIK